MAFFAAVGKSLIDVVPVAEKNRQVAPGRARCSDPKKSVEEQPGVAARPALARGDMWLDQGPFCIGQGVLWSSNFGHDDRFVCCHFSFVDGGRHIAQC